MWIVKIGGSWIKNQKLSLLISSLQKFVDEKIVLVAGGGIFADAVREIYKLNKISEEKAHFLALKATELFAYYLESFNSKIYLTSELTKFNNRSLNIWLPSKKLTLASEFEKNWESTSDSIASWLYSKTNAKGIIFIKSVKFISKKTQKLKDLQKEKILDLNVKKYLNEKKNLKIVGPEIIDLLDNSKDWNFLISKLGKIIV